MYDECNVGRRPIEAEPLNTPCPALYTAIHRTSEPPQLTPTVHQAVRWIAQLGGFLPLPPDAPSGDQSADDTSALS